MGTPAAKRRGNAIVYALFTERRCAGCVRKYGIIRMQMIQNQLIFQKIMMILRRLESDAYMNSEVYDSMTKHYSNKLNIRRTKVDKAVLTFSFLTPPCLS